MVQNDILFSLILSLVNTFAFYVLTNRKQNQEVKDRRNEYLMMFGITFVTSFILRTCLGVILTQKGGGGGMTEPPNISHSSRPPF
tara:strand:+ start:255 stop:509 length:255 start_codon:yes stop_codon:yes gene_type:complete